MTFRTFFKDRTVGKERTYRARPRGLITKRPPPGQSQERRHKAQVRLRDRYCRMPLCGCWRFRLSLHVSHQQHKGMGGNPKGDRSHPDRMLLVCGPRHRENRISIDNHTLRWREIGRDVDGHVLVAWDVDRHALAHRLGALLVHQPDWFEVARESALHRFEPFTPEQRAVLERLAEMKI